MTNLTVEKIEISPAETHALIVGIETYDVALESLDGSANDAIVFANWLLDKGVNPENIHLFVSPLPENQHLLENISLNYLPATQVNISQLINFHLINDENLALGELLYVFWSGHGLITQYQDTRRRLFFSDIN